MNIRKKRKIFLECGLIYFFTYILSSEAKSWKEPFSMVWISLSDNCLQVNSIKSFLSSCRFRRITFTVYFFRGANEKWVHTLCWHVCLLYSGKNASLLSTKHKKNIVLFITFILVLCTKCMWCVRTYLHNFFYIHACAHMYAIKASDTTAPIFFPRNLFYKKKTQDTRKKAWHTERTRKLIGYVYVNSKRKKVEWIEEKSTLLRLVYRHTHTHTNKKKRTHLHNILWISP